MNALQKRLLELVKEIDTICKKHKITYYFDGGSAIGAIRHNGFIPWDDDIDIVMTRDNYKKFVNVIDEEIRADRKFESIDRNDKYTMLYARYCDRTSTAILRTSMLDAFESGVFIDIFILDPIPDDERKQKKYLKLFKAYAEYINPYYYDTVTCSDYKTIKILRFLGRVWGRKKLYRYVEKKLFSYEEDACSSYCFRFDLSPFIYQKDYFQEPQMLPFEDMLAPVPTKVNDYLIQHYGDNWMYIPNEANQETHNVVINLNVPYHSFKSQYYNLLPPNIIKKYSDFHYERVKSYNNQRAVKHTEMRIQAEYKKNKFNEELSALPIVEEFEKKKYHKVFDFFSNYYEEQLKKEYIKNSVIIDIDLLELALITLVENGRYYDAEKIISISSHKYPRIKEKVDIAKKLNHLFYDKCFEEYIQLVAFSYDDNDDVIDCVEGKIFSLIHSEKYDAALDLIEKALNIFLKKDFLLKYKADIICLKKNMVVKTLYKDVLNNTNNGLIIQEVQNILRENTTND